MKRKFESCSEEEELSEEETLNDLIEDLLADLVFLKEGELTEDQSENVRRLLTEIIK